MNINRVPKYSQETFINFRWQWIFPAIVLMMSIFSLKSCTSNKTTMAASTTNPTGYIRSCTFTMQEYCPTCYSLETTEHGKEIIDYTAIGDLAVLLDKRVEYQGTRDPKLVSTTKMCPATIKLTMVKQIED